MDSSATKLKRHGNTAKSIEPQLYHQGFVLAGPARNNYRIISFLLSLILSFVLSRYYECGASPYL
jgi:hypothetical protein